MNANAYLYGLNQAQKEAVLHTEGPLLIVAGAGAGKTTTITHRIAHLLYREVPSRHILAVTFTNKAANEMRERVHALLPVGKGPPFVSTFHAFGVRVLREFHQEAGLPRGFSIWDRDDSVKAIKQIVGGLGIDLSPKNVLSTISREKGEGVAHGVYAKRAVSHREQTIARIWNAYDRTLCDEHALDFDDLLLSTLELIANRETVRSRLEERFRYLTIDEYQDTNAVQIEIARILAGEKKNICVVGDVDQNIYSWRGADIEHLLSFEKTFPGTKVVVLEQNYRSTRSILTVAASVIEKNMRRTPKKLFTENETGEPLVFFGAENEGDEAWFVGESAQRLIEGGTNANEIAVLYRENFQSRALEEVFLHAGIPYRVLGTKFFERKEVKDVLAYLRATLNPRSASDITRIVSVPPRGIGKVTLQKIFAGREEELPPSARKKVASFRTILSIIKKSTEIAPASEAVRAAIEKSGIERHLKKNEDGEERLANVAELVNLATRFDHEPPPSGVEKLLEEAALQGSEEGSPERETNASHAVSLMTMHASKGLEFDVVFVTGLEQGLFPSSREEVVPGRSRDPEEERRLFYVALTRARKRVFLSYARSRMRYGSREHTMPSEFLDDIDSRFLVNGAKSAAHQTVIR